MSNNNNNNSNAVTLQIINPVPSNVSYVIPNNIQQLPIPFTQMPINESFPDPTSPDIKIEDSQNDTINTNFPSGTLRQLGFNHFDNSHTGSGNSNDIGNGIIHNPNYPVFDRNFGTAIGLPNYVDRSNPDGTFNTSNTIDSPGFGLRELLLSDDINKQVPIHQNNNTDNLKRSLMESESSDTNTTTQPTYPPKKRVKYTHAKDIGGKNSKSNNTTHSHNNSNSNNKKSNYNNVNNNTSHVANQFVFHLNENTDMTKISNFIEKQKSNVD